jgi:hypothetical protein
LSDSDDAVAFEEDGIGPRPTRIARGDAGVDDQALRRGAHDTTG